MNSRILSFNNKSNIPTCGEDIFFLGRAFKSRDELTKWLKTYKSLGYSLIVEKSEVKRGRFQLICNKHSKKNQESKSSNWNKLTMNWNAHVYIYKFIVKKVDLIHCHNAESKSWQSINFEDLAQSNSQRELEQNNDELSSEYNIDI